LILVVGNPGRFPGRISNLFLNGLLSRLLTFPSFIVTGISEDDFFRIEKHLTGSSG